MINPTLNPKGNNLADQIIRERISAIQLVALIAEFDWAQKIAVVQLACNQIGNREPQLIKLHPMGEYFDEQLQAAILLMGQLPPDILTEIALQTLEEISYPNE